MCWSIGIVQQNSKGDWIVENIVKKYGEGLGMFSDLLVLSTIVQYFIFLLDFDCWRQ
jgi:hypothetical protein